MQKTKSKLIIAREDHELIVSNLRNGAARSSFNRQEAEALEKEIRCAELVSAEKLPGDVVRLNSLVTVSDAKGKQMSLTVVLPFRADISNKKISVMSPMGAALIGYRKGSKVSWNAPSGKRTVTIVEVVNSYNTQQTTHPL